MAWHTLVVGAGSAGCVLAARLSEDSGRRVLLIEAGPDYPARDALPADIASPHRPTYSHEWGYLCEPGRVGRSFKLPRGKLVGGCSAMNATIALRGHPFDYDEWAALGNPGWSWDEVLPYFRRLERDLDFDAPWHGQSGPTPIGRAQEDDLLPRHRAFLESCAAVGFKAAPDLNLPGVAGAGPFPRNVEHGVRVSAALAYLEPARSRPNLEIRAGASADRIVIERGRATGVALAGSGGTLRADEIVLAAGAYGSPAVLLRSGVGPADALRRLGIAVVADLPGVGEGLADHPLLGVTFAVPPPAIQDPVPLFQTPFLLRSPQAGAAPDLMIAPRSALAVKPEQSPTGATAMLFVSVLKPYSRGRLTLRSADPDAAPIIDLGYFTDPRDMPRMIEGLRTLRRIAGTGPLAGLAGVELLPGSSFGDNDEGLERAILSRVETFHHPVGTCRMGPASDPLAVVDVQGRVRGVEALRVVDAAILPAIPAANTHLPVTMVAERIAAWMRGESAKTPPG